jgi:hypothetical protein
MYNVRHRLIEDNSGETNEGPVEWIISEPNWKNPFDNLTQIVRGLCVPHQESSIKNQQHRSTTENTRDRSRTFSTSSTTQLLYINSTLSDDECDDDSQSSGSANAIANSFPSFTSKQILSGSSASATRMMSSTDILEPLYNLKRSIFTGTGFCDPFIQYNSKDDKISIRDNQKDLDSTISVQDDDSEYVDCYEFESEYDDESEDFEEILVETQPGTSRVYRVYQAMEMFCSAVLILMLTFQALRRMDTHQPLFQFTSKNVQNSKWLLQITKA